jgi:hypothetical protein
MLILIGAMQIVQCKIHTIHDQRMLSYLKLLRNHQYDQVMKDECFINTRYVNVVNEF